MEEEYHGPPLEEGLGEEEEGMEELGGLQRLQLASGEPREVRHNPDEHYAGLEPGEALPEREVTQTDHLNAKLLSAFDRLLSEGKFKMAATEPDSEWPEEDDQ
jgi:hypothetical protein